MNGRTNDEMVRIAEQRLDRRADGTGDQYTPTFITVNPDGSITFDFSGHISARGIDLPSAPDAILQTDSLITWTREADDTRSTYIQGYTFGAGADKQGGLVLQAEAKGAGNPVVQARAQQPDVANQPYMELGLALPGGLPEATLTLKRADNISIQKDLLRSDNTADYYVSAGWTNLPALQNGWSVYAGTNVAQYRVAGNWVECRGEIQAPAAGAGLIAPALLWTFPAGARPAVRAYCILHGNINTGRDVFIDGLGQVQTGFNINANEVCNLNDIRFPLS